MTQPTFEAVDMTCPICEAAAVVYVPSNLMRGDLEMHCFGCDSKETIFYDRTPRSDGVGNQILARWEKLKSESPLLNSKKYRGE